MECKRCSKKIEEFEIYCDDCKEVLKQEKEFTELIDKNKELNKLEITKEIDNLDSFKDEKNENIIDLKEELKDIVNIEEIETETNNKKIIIIVSCVVVLLLILIIILLFSFNKKEHDKVEEPEVIDYEKIINNYGEAVKLALSKYLESNEEVPSWSVISDLIIYEEYEVVCDIHHIYKDQNIYLNECKVDNKIVEYSYGVKQEEVKEGKKVEIYKVDSENYYYSYSSNNEENSQLVGFITCKTEDCEYVSAYTKYVLIKENNEYYIYNYETNSIEFGPFSITSQYAENNILVYENELYGILYEIDGKKNIYNINTGKTLKNIEGELMLPTLHFSPNIMYKYGYAILINNNKNNFVNLKTGNVSYTIDGKINTFIEDTTKDLVYITTHNTENSKITIYNSNGKKLFNGKEFNNLQISDGNLIVSSDYNFYVYDTDLKLKTSSKEYNDILHLYNNFIVVIDNEYLEIVDYQDNILATFDLKWDKDKYEYETQLSGWYTDTEIKLIINNKEQTIGNFLECYYNTETKEFKVTEISHS